MTTQSCPIHKQWFSRGNITCTYARTGGILCSFQAASTEQLQHVCQRQHDVHRPHLPHRPIRQRRGVLVPERHDPGRPGGIVPSLPPRSAVQADAPPQLPSSRHPHFLYQHRGEDGSIRTRTATTAADPGRNAALVRSSGWASNILRRVLTAVTTLRCEASESASVTQRSAIWLSVMSFLDGIIRPNARVEKRTTRERFS